jgi:hypothetical protein
MAAQDARLGIRGTAGRECLSRLHRIRGRKVRIATRICIANDLSRPNRWTGQ